LSELITYRPSQSRSNSEKQLLSEFDKLYYKNYCLNYLQKNHNYDCDIDLLNTGLETATIYCLEKSKKLLNDFKLSPKDKQSSIKIVNSRDYQQIGKKIIHSNQPNF
jgi:hypothetical protein